MSFLWLLADEDPPVGSPPSQAARYNSGPWFATQLVLSLATGVSSFLAFCFLRTRWKVLYAPRTLLKGFSPHEVHTKSGFFGWILPTLRTSEYAVLQLVGLDAVVLLSFLKFGFYFFSICSLLGCGILIPINWRQFGTIDGVPPPRDVRDKDDSRTPLATPDLFLVSHLVFTYVFSLIALYMLHRAYTNFVVTKQLFGLDHAQSIPARTVMITRVPPHLRGEKQLADYFEGMGESMHVESVNVLRQTSVLSELLEIRTEALRKLETAWASYVGNPAQPNSNYDRDREAKRIVERDIGKEDDDALAVESTDAAQLIDHQLNGGTNGHLPDPEAQTQTDKFALPNKPRPTVRSGFFPLSLFRTKQDLLEHLAENFRAADAAVLLRRKGRFRPTEVAFVTFETVAGAQIASQVVHYPQPSAMLTTLAPEPRDVYWSNLALSTPATAMRKAIVALAVILLLFFWGTPTWFLARLLSFETIKSYSPKLAKLINRFPPTRAFVQNSFPSLALIAFTALLPYILEGLFIFQGLKAKSWIEYTLMKQYYIFLLVTVFFVFVSVSTLTLARDLANQPMKFVERLATSLPVARNFYVSYVMLQGIGIMPVQLVQLATIIPNFIWRIFYTRTPRDYAELNAPPVLNLGVSYPPALLIFLICLTYSIIMPIILPFGAIYFGMAYLVYKYKLLNVYYRPFESRGQAWPIAFSRVSFGIVVFQLFQIGLFTVQLEPTLVIALVPLLFGTIYASYRMNRTFARLGKHVNLSQACEVVQQGSAAAIQTLKRANPVTASQTNLNRQRYKHKDDNLYVVAKHDKTDYSQPPLSDVFYGVLNTGRRRYGHPALSGTLPRPWLPQRKETTTNPPSGLSTGDVIQLSLRRRWSELKKSTGLKPPAVDTVHEASIDDATRAWRESDEQGWQNVEGDSDSDAEEADGSKYRTFYAHPERRRRQLPGGWNQQESDSDT